MSRLMDHGLPNLPGPSESGIVNALYEIVRTPNTRYPTPYVPPAGTNRCNQPVTVHSGGQAHPMEWTKPFPTTARQDRSEFDALVQRFHRQAYNIAYRMMGNHADAE